MSKKLEIFKPGTHTAMSGKTLDFSDSDLAASVAAYDPAKHEAPLVVGHPKVDAPAYGWVKSLNFADGILIAEPDQVDVAFAAMVNDGKFKKISASFFLPDAANNPVPGVYYLRHVGFLGATPPAVKGLKSASFSEAEDGVVTFGEWDDRLVASLFRTLKNWLIGKFGQDEADKALNEWDVQTVSDIAAQPEPEDCGSPSPSFAEPGKELDMDVKLKEENEKLKQQVADFASREDSIKKQEAAARHTENVSFADGLVAGGTLLPVQKDRIVALLDFAGAGEGSVEFSEADGGKKCEPLLDSLKSFLSAQPKIVDFGESAKPEDETANVVNFSTPPGYTVDPAGLELHHKAQAYQQKNPGVDYIAAVKVCQ